MVHARAFSFYDDAVSVALPSTDHASSLLVPSGSIAKPSLPDASVALFKLRQLQSGWYQTLFQSDPTDPLPDATSFVWQKCFELQQWAKDLPDGLPAGIRKMLDLELRYTYVYCIAPSERAPHLTAYGRLLIFEHAVAYIDGIYAVANAPTSSAFYSYHDVLRVYFIGSQFVAVLRDAGDLLLSGSPVPVPVSAPGKPMPPPLPQRIDCDAGDNLDRSLRCLERVVRTLKLYGDRWDDALSLMASFEAMSAEVIEGLKARRAVGSKATGAVQAKQAVAGQRIPQPDSRPVEGPVVPAQRRAPFPQQPPQAQEARWMDVDVAPIIRGGGQI